MLGKLSSLSRQGLTLERIFKLVLIFVFGILLYYLVQHQGDLSGTYQTFVNGLDASRLPLLLVVALMMPVNWYWESVKWRMLMSPLARLSMTTASKSVLVGLATSLFTPNRIGEYLGRVWLAPKGKRWQAAAALLLGSFVQMAMIGILGLLAILYLLNHGVGLAIIPSDGQWIAVFAVMLMALGCFFGAGRIVGWIRQQLPDPWRDKITKHLLFYQNYGRQQSWKILCYTIGRLILYTFQYFLLLRFFGISAHWLICISSILACYFIQTNLPIPASIGLLARGEITLLIWNYFDVNELSVLAASYSLWVINVLLPALVGMVFVLKMNMLKSLEYGSK